MKELNFSNADLSIDNKLVFEKEINEENAIKIDSSTILFNDIKTTNDILVNYSLTSFSNIYAKKIVVQKDLICYGDITCENLEVYGEIKCYGVLDVKNIEVSENAIIGGGILEKGRFDNNLIIIESLEVVTELKTDGNIICNEGILGDGIVECNKIIANDYIEVEVLNNSEEVILGENPRNNEMNLDVLQRLESAKDIQEYLDSKDYYNIINILHLTCDKIKNMIPLLEDDFEYEEIIEILSKLSSLSSEFDSDKIIFKNVLDLSEVIHMDDLVMFLKLVNYRRIASSHIREISLCNDMLNNFVNKELLKIYEMNVDSIETHSDFVNALNLLEKNKEFFNEVQYMYIINTVYSKIGIKANMLKKFIQLGDV